MGGGRTGPTAAQKHFYERVSAWLSRLHSKEGLLRPTLEGLQWRFSKSRGPGGQHVNKVNSKAALHLTLEECSWIPSEVRSHLPTRLLFQSDAHRSQEENKRECLTKLHAHLVRIAHTMTPSPPSPEQMARVERFREEAKAQRRQMKEQQSAIKASRRIKGDDKMSL